MNKNRLVLIAAVVGVSLIAKAADTDKLPPASTKETVTYAADIKPIFEETCIKCHGPQKQKAKLRLDNRAAVLKGGEDGKVVKVGDSAKSMLVLSVAHVGDPDTYMPKAPRGEVPKRLPPEQVGLIRAWIDQGAR